MAISGQIVTGVFRRPTPWSILLFVVASALPAYLKEGTSSLEILLYGDVGFGALSSAAIAKLLKTHGAVEKIVLRVSSPGGDAFDGITIHNLLAKHPARVEAHIDGQASSAASLIVMAADRIHIAANSVMMVHEARGGHASSAAEHESDAKALRVLNDSAADIYAARTRRAKDEILAIMQAGTWMSAQEALERGFADEITDARGMAATVALFLGGKTMQDDEDKTMQDEAEAEVSGDSLIAALAEDTGLAPAAVIALLSDKRAEVVALLNAAVEQDGSEAEANAEPVEDERMRAHAVALKVSERQIAKLGTRIQELENERARAREAGMEAEIRRMVSEGYLLDSDVEDARKWLSADPTAARRLLTRQKAVPVRTSQAGAEDTGRREFAKIDQLPEGPRLLAFNLKHAGFGDEAACIARAIKEHGA